MRYALGVCMVLLFGATSPAWAQVAPDAVEIDPIQHYVVLENDHVRVFEVRASPGAQSPLHSHPPLVAISLARGHVQMAGPDGEPFVFDLHPGQAYWMQDVQHSWELLSGQVHVIAVEPKAAARGASSAAAPLPASDAVTVDPTHHHVIMENDHVRVIEVLAAPGARSPMHTHPPLVAVSLGTARSTMAGPDGNQFVFDLRPAQVIWMDGVEHTWDLLAGEVHVIAVEVKAAR
jgi:quercetin dioxygenase-like cupin family protein